MGVIWSYVLVFILSASTSDRLIMAKKQLHFYHFKGSTHKPNIPYWIRFRYIILPLNSCPLEHLPIQIRLKNLDTNSWIERLNSTLYQIFLRNHHQMSLGAPLTITLPPDIQLQHWRLYVERRAVISVYIDSYRMRIFRGVFNLHFSSRWISCIKMIIFKATNRDWPKHTRLM